MRQVLLSLLRCPHCRRGALALEAVGAELLFGPLRCQACEVSYPVSEGVVDLVLDRTPTLFVEKAPAVLQSVR